MFGENKQKNMITVALTLIILIPILYLILFFKNNKNKDTKLDFWDTFWKILGYYRVEPIDKATRTIDKIKDKMNDFIDNTEDKINNNTDDNTNDNTDVPNNQNNINNNNSDKINTEIESEKITEYEIKNDDLI